VAHPGMNGEQQRDLVDLRAQFPLWVITCTGRDWYALPAWEDGRRLVATEPEQLVKKMREAQPLSASLAGIPRVEVAWTGARGGR
jgi:hypothetical protein